MEKIISLKCLVDQTLVKNEFGRKIKVTKDDIFTTDSITAETYLTVYKRHFALADSGEKSNVSPTEIIALENKVQELESENEALKETVAILDKQLVDFKLEALRLKHEGKTLEEIPYNDLREIAKLKGLTFKGSPKIEELREAIKNADTQKENETPKTV